MKFFNANGVLQKARRYISGSAGIQQDDISSPEKLQQVLRTIQQRVAGLETRTPPEGLEFELNVGTGGAITTVPHNIGGPVRWYVTSWTQTPGVMVPILPATLVEDDTSTKNTLALRSYVTGRAVVRVEPAFVALSYGQTVPYVPPATPSPTQYFLSNANIITVTSTSLTDTVFKFNGLAGETWRLEYNAMVNAGANGFAYAIKAPVSSAVECQLSALSTTTSAWSEQRINSVNAASAFFHTTALGTAGFDRIHAVVTLASAGTVGIQLAAASSSSGNIFANASFIAQKVTPL